MRFLALLPLVAGCAADSNSTDVVGPFIGTTHRFVIDSYTLPTSSAQVTALGDDLNGDGTIDNQVGALFSTLATGKDLAANPLAMRAVLPTTFVIQADDLANDDHVGVSYIGHPGDTALAVGGTFTGGVFTSNRSTSDHTAEGALVLPVFADADPTTFALDHGEIDLTPDATGYVATLRGTVDLGDTLHVAAIGLAQMVMNNPKDHWELGTLFDANGDGRLAVSEVESAPFLKSLLAPDLNNSQLSMGFSVHLVACDEGDCISTPTTDTCHDRVLDGDETAIDCGGSCQPCGYDAACVVASDCQTGACDQQICRMPTCSDGIQDGLETGVDCGGDGCPLCPGQQCETSNDCPNHSECFFGSCGL
jgi:hypothetical protein